MSELKVGDKIKLNKHYPMSADHWKTYPFPPIGAEGVIVKIYPGGWQDCRFDGYPDGLDDDWYIHTDWIEGQPAAEQRLAAELAALRAENARLVAENERLEANKMRILNRALIAETNEATFRELLVDAECALKTLPQPSVADTHLRGRITDTLATTQDVNDRE